MEVLVLKNIRSVVIVAITALFLIGLIVLPAMALDESVTEITSDGWVNYKKLNVIQFTYKVNDGQNESYVTKNVNNLSLPYGPRYYILSDQIISEFWLEIALYNVDVDEPTDSNNAINSSIAVIKPGESVSLMTGAKIFVAGRPEQSAFAPIEANMYGCRLYLDNDYHRYIEPFLEVSTSNGAYLTWTFENNTDKDISLSRICFGLFEDSPIPIDSYGYGYSLRFLKYRIFTDSQKATQAVVDAITGLGDQVVGLGYKIDGIGDQIESGIQQSTDQITGGWSPDPVPPDGSEEIDQYHAIEQHLLDASEGGILSGLTFVGDLTTNMTIFNNGFLGMVKIWDLFNAIEWLRVVVCISLALGIIGFFLNFASSARQSRR